MEEYEGIDCSNCGKYIDYEDEIYYCPYCGNRLNGPKEIVLQNELEKQVYSWLAKRLNIDDILVSETIKNQMATVFLLMWPIIEKNIFNGDMSHNNIKNLSEKYESCIIDDDIDYIAKHFYLRYKDNKELYNKLINGDREWYKITNMLTYPYNKIYKKNKIAFMIFVVYRFRNNIFHGNKAIDHWVENSEEIQYCIEFMLVLGDCIDNKE